MRSFFLFQVLVATTAARRVAVVGAGWGGLGAAHALSKQPDVEVVLLALLVVAILAVAWFTRERIARTVLDDFFASRGIEARYSVEEIGPSRQVVTDIVLGDPDSPDLTADRIEVQISPRFGIPTIESVRLVSPGKARRGCSSAASGRAGRSLPA